MMWLLIKLQIKQQELRYRVCQVNVGWIPIEIPTEKYTPPGKKQQIIDKLRSM